MLDDLHACAAPVDQGLDTTQGLFAKGTCSDQIYPDTTNRLMLRQAGIGEITRSTTTLTD
ncbi:MAG: hypothetical protein WKF48_02225 [Solirubrobacteraceae bacterium]